MQEHQTSEDTHYSKIRPTGECSFTSKPAETYATTQNLSHVNSHTCTFKALLQSTTPVQSTKNRRVDRYRQACSGHNVVPSISCARPGGTRQRVRSVAEQIESLNCNRHGLLCSCQRQSLHSVGGHYNIRLFKLSRLTRRRMFTIFPLRPRRAQDSQIDNFNCCCGRWVFAFQ